MQSVDLSGTWRAVVADEERRRTFADLDADDSSAAGWSDLRVPSHWRSNPAFARTDGPLLTRRRFSLPARGRIDVESTPTGQDRWWLVLDGVAYQGDVWLDGHYVGDTEGYFFPHGFDVTDLLADGDDHVLAVEVTCSPASDRTAKRNLTGSLQHSTWLDPSWNPGGIWRGVRVERSGPLRIRHFRVRCTEASPSRAVLALRAVIDAQEPGTATLRTTVRPHEADDASDPACSHHAVHVLAAGENRVEWTVEVDDPDLWWPHALGAQPLYDVDVDVVPGGDPDEPDAEPDEPVDANSLTGDAAPSDHRRIRTGLRRIEMSDWILSVNGQRLFLKGTNLGPTRQDLAAATPEQVRADVAAAKDLGLDLIRVHSHVARPELYAAADEAGMLVWQDLPLQWAYARSVRHQAVRQAREAVDLLAHHPSVAIWCGHNEPLGVGTVASGTGDDDATAVAERRRRRLGQVLPSWNRSILDRSIRRTLRSVDGTRPVIAHSGVLPHFPQLDGTDSHLWFGWAYGQIGDLARAARLWPRLVRFVSELGAQAVPTRADFCEPHRWPDLDWDELAARHGLRKDLLDRIADPADHDTFADWRVATQRHQAELLRRQVETLRRLKYRPTGGFAQFLLADGHPAISHSVLDHERRPKLGHAALRDACRPVIVVADPLPIADGRRRGRHASTNVDVHVVSDLRVTLVDVEVTAELHRDGADPVTHRWIGRLPADECSRIGTIDVPSGPAGDGTTLRLTVTGSDGDVIATNEYVR
ncbi:glycoside hydrolase family 2 protein [Actinomarinicola tropica]|uniref:glycoside hydrolase family 2 protein n=1 Tax=Actinomarinicola tropica TaxID=2789776 RepID=UPI00189C53BF|nr:sugar-binding domain-containing protein [Actinomarinicola tropica]